MPLAGKESVKAYWKQILNEMKEKGLSTMSVMSDDSITVSSDGRTNNSNLCSMQQLQGKKTCPSYKRIAGEILLQMFSCFVFTYQIF
jgi:predicted phosphoadenosine phosphosulfate sulfurtransferase